MCGEEVDPLLLRSKRSKNVVCRMIFLRRIFEGSNDGILMGWEDDEVGSNLIKKSCSLEKINR